MNGIILLIGAYIMLKLSLPITMKLTKNPAAKSKPLNLNTYRNLNHFSNNTMKANFLEIVKGLLPKNFRKIEQPVSLFYTIYPPDKKPFDVSNICSIVDKFACDALTDGGVWEDDNWKHVRSITYIYGEVDKLNPRCELEVMKCVDKGVWSWLKALLSESETV